MRESLPEKKKGDTLGARYVNRLGAGVRASSSDMGPPPSFRGSFHASGISEEQYEWSAVIQSREVDDSDDEESGLYLFRFRYYDFADELWKTDTEDYQLDSRGMFAVALGAISQRGPVLVYGDHLMVRYDEQRGMFVPTKLFGVDSRWAWVDTVAVGARSEEDTVKLSVKLVKESLLGNPLRGVWSYLQDADSNDVYVDCWNGFTAGVGPNMHIRIGHNSIGQYEVKGVPCQTESALS